MKISIKCLYLFLFAFVCHALPGPQQQERFPGEQAYRESIQRVAAKSTLTYKGTCSFSDEKKRADLGKKLVDMMFSFDFSQISTITAGFNSLADAPGEYCNANKSLECTSQGTCGCTSGESQGMSLKTNWMEGKCWYISGSTCYPQAPPEAFGTKTSDLRCEGTSECMMKGSNTRKCTLETMQEKILEEYGGPETVQKDILGYMRFLKKMTFEGVCVCSSVAGIRSNLAYAVLLLFVVSLLNLTLV